MFGSLAVHRTGPEAEWDIVPRYRMHTKSSATPIQLTKDEFDAVILLPSLLWVTFVCERLGFQL